jgi:patatin-like phospholipase/acyl hydrolase
VNKYRVLSFDGGGIRGLLSAVILEQLEKRVGKGWIQRADLMAGTSAGGMIALGLAHGMSPSQLRSLFYDRGPIMFEDSLVDDLVNLWRIVGAEYSTDNRRAVLEHLFGSTTLGNLRNNVLISTFDLHDPHPSRNHWKAKFFHNLHTGPKATGTDRDKRASDVALYTTAAPTIFPSVDGYIDGGVVAQNPAMAAVAQTRDPDYWPRRAPDGSGTDEGVEIDDIVLLSIGTGRNLNRIEGEEKDWGYLQWMRHWVDVFLDEGLTEVVHYQCSQILGSKYCRINPIFRNGTVGTDEYEKRDYLVQIAETGADMQRALDAAAEWIDNVWS